MDSSSSSSSSCVGRPLIVGPAKPQSPYPIFVSGAVVKGYGRGSKQLGIPTANLPEEAVQRALADIAIGVYYGWAQVVDQNGGGPVLPMVMSLGWNPFFKNEKRSGEVHIIHKFSEDFYGKDLRIAIVGFIREEKNYESLDALVDDINMDIKVAQESLKRKAYMDVNAAPFFRPSSSSPLISSTCN
ncbi:riboflavin kinase [Coemansia sp. RSA 1836]|nr:riboflavin kinase [Coemansia sp. RSA 1836]